MTAPDRAPMPPAGSGLVLAPAMAIANIHRAINEANEALIVGNFDGMLVALEEIERMTDEIEKTI